MNQKLRLSSLLALTILPVLGAQAQVYNLNDYDNFADEYGQNQFNPYVGPGAYPGATSSDYWNGFGLESDGNHPYPATGLLSNTAGVASGIGYTVNYDGNNGGLYFSPGPYQGTPAFLLGQAAIVTGTDVGTLDLTDVPTGSYDLYLYGANFDGTRGAQFTVNTGTPLDGLSATTNPNTSSGSGPLDSFTLGVDYVEFLDVTPVNGDIDITWAQNPNDNSGGGEGDFNGLSLVVATPEPSSLALFGVGIAGILIKRFRK